MAKIEQKCSECNMSFSIEVKYINQKKKEGQIDFWCSTKCRNLFKTKIFKIVKKCKKCSTFFTTNRNEKQANMFCSRKCGNSRTWTEEDKKQRAISCKSSRKVLEFNKSKFLGYRTVICQICKKDFICKISHPRKCCERKCSDILSRINGKGNAGGYREKSGIGKSGYYKEIFCNSTYELAFVIWNIDNGIFPKRCNRFFNYSENKRYYPDFEIDDIIYEIKGYYTPIVNLKKEAVEKQGIEYRLLFKKDIQHMIDYVKDKYKVKKLEVLYNTSNR